MAVLCQKEGHYPYSNSIGYSLNPTGVLDIIGGALILVPAMGLLPSGVWSLDETDIVVRRQPK